MGSDGARVDGNPWAARDVEGEARGGLGECDHEVARTGRAEADCGKIGERASDERAGVFHREKEIGFRCRGRGREDAAVGIDKVRGGDGFAVGPAGVKAEVKCVNEAVRGNVEAIGRGGQGRPACGVGDEEAFAERADDEEFVRQRGSGRIEIGGFVALADAENRRRRRRAGGGLAFRAGGQQKQGGEDAAARVGAKHSGNRCVPSGSGASPSRPDARG